MKRDSGHNCLEVMPYLLVAEAKDAEPSGGEDSVPLSVLLLTAFVYCTVYLYDQPGAMAEEINDVSGDDALTTKVDAVQTVAS